jgi:hypothetical protein
VRVLACSDRKACGCWRAWQLLAFDLSASPGRYLDSGLWLPTMPLPKLWSSCAVTSSSTTWATWCSPATQMPGRSWAAVPSGHEAQSGVRLPTVKPWLYHSLHPWENDLASLNPSSLVCQRAAWRVAAWRVAACRNNG